MKEKILHVFWDDLDNITYNMKNIRYAGFTAIQIPPIQPVKHPECKEFWMYYQPTDFSIRDLEKFKRLCDSAHTYGIKVIVDFVGRHLGGLDDGRLYPHENCNAHICSKRDYWLPPIPGSDANNRFQCTNRCWGLPAINYFNNEIVWDIHYNFLKTVLTYADGIRVDMGKHYALPYENGHSEFWYMIKEVTKDKICYAECLDINQSLFNDYANYCDVLTNFVPYENKNKRVAFFESHDTYYTWKSTCWMNDDERMRQYEQLLREYDKVLFFARPWDKLIFSDRMREVNSKFF